MNLLDAILQSIQIDKIQAMANSWFGSRWFGILRAPYITLPFIRGSKPPTQTNNQRLAGKISSKKVAMENWKKPDEQNLRSGEKTCSNMRFVQAQQQHVAKFLQVSITHHGHFPIRKRIKGLANQFCKFQTRFAFVGRT